PARRASERRTPRPARNGCSRSNQARRGRSCSWMGFSMSCISSCAIGYWMAGRPPRCSMICTTCSGSIGICCGPMRGWGSMCRATSGSGGKRWSVSPDGPSGSGLAFAAGIAGGTDLGPALVPLQHLHVAIIPPDRLDRMAQFFQRPALLGTEGRILDLDMVGQVLMMETRAADPLLHRPACHRFQGAEQHHADDTAAAGCTEHRKLVLIF